MMKKRWTLKLALCLLAGAMVTWGVAWGCALWSPVRAVSSQAARNAIPNNGGSLLADRWLPTLPPMTPWTPIPETTGQVEPSELEYTLRSYTESDFEPPKYRRFTCTTHLGAGISVVECTMDEVIRNLNVNPLALPRARETRCGWPLLVLEGWGELSGYGPNIEEHLLATPHRILQRLPHVRKVAFGEWPRLPYRVIPLGFALNTLFYAAVLLGAVECVAFARRRVRHRKGRCPSCGYDRVGLAAGSACPECGAKA
jgi:hypothetical protein